MTYCEFNQNRSSPFLCILLLTILVVVVSITFVTVVNNGNNHSLEKHGIETVESIQFCLTKNGELQLWQKNNRFARLCQVNENLYGIEIIEKKGNIFEHVTAFFKDKMRTLSQVENYLSNTGYVRIK